MANAEVSSVALTELKTDLKVLSDDFHQIYDLMTADLSQIGETWRDSKYDDFRKAYGKQISECDNIADRYDAWCIKVLDPAIDKVAEIEQSNVVVDDDGGTTSAGSSSGDGRKVVERPKPTSKPASSEQPRPRPNNASKLTGTGSGRPSPRGNASQSSHRPSPINRPMRPKGGSR